MEGSKMGFKELVCADLIAKIEKFGIPLLHNGATSGAYTDGEHVITFSVGLLGKTTYSSNYRSLGEHTYGTGATVATGGVTTSSPKTWEIVLNDDLLTKDGLLALCKQQGAPVGTVRLLSIKEYKQQGLWMHKFEARRFNQPSTRQDYHHRHGANVLAELHHNNGTATVYYIDDTVLSSPEPMQVLINKCELGRVESELVPISSLSCGWW